MNERASPTRTHFLFFSFAIVVAVVPALRNNYYMQIATFVCMYSALALSWNIIGGYTGYPSFSTAAFIGLGAYAGGLLQNAGLPAPLAWLGATAIAGIFSYALGFAILRIKGHYFAIGSIAIVEILRLVTSSWSKLTGGGDGLNVRLLAGTPEAASAYFLYAMLVVMLLAYLMTVWVEGSRLGFGLRCIKQNENAADALGVNVNAYKRAALTLSALFCGTVGAIAASWTGYISPTDAFSIVMTLKVPVMVLLGGAGTVLGPIVGACSFVLMEQTIWARFLEWNQAVLGVVIVLSIFFLPGGLLKLRPAGERGQRIGERTTR